MRETTNLDLVGFVLKQIKN